MFTEPPLMVFVSSVMNQQVDDMDAERVAVRDAVGSIDVAIPWLFEWSPASGGSLDESYLSKVRSCDVFVLIVGTAASQPVIREYETAILHRRRCLVFVRRGNHDGSATALIRSVIQKYQTFSSSTELRDALRASLADEIRSMYRRGAYSSPGLQSAPDWGVIVDRCHNQVQAELQRLGRKYHPELYIPRAAAAELESFLTSQDQSDVWNNLSSQAAALQAHDDGNAKLFASGFLSIHYDRPIHGTTSAAGQLRQWALDWRQRVNPPGRRQWHIQASDLLSRALRLAGTTFAVVDAAGRGKTNLLCSMASALSASSPVLLFSGRRPMVDEKSLARDIQTALGFPESADPLACFEALQLALVTNHKRLFVFLDAINENAELFLLRANLNFLITALDDAPVKFILSCRDSFWAGRILLPDEPMETHLRGEISLGPFTPVEFDKAWATYQHRFDLQFTLHPRARDRLRHPLLLRMFAETYSSLREELHVDEIADVRLVDLFDTYWRLKSESISQRSGVPTRTVEHFLLASASFMLASARRDIDRTARLPEFESATTEMIIDAALDEDIILEEGPGHGTPAVTFVYDEFMEYVLARAIFASTQLPHRSERQTLQLCRTHMRSAGNYPPLFGACGYLLNMLARDRNWFFYASCATFARSDRRWTDVLWRSFLQLPIVRHRELYASFRQLNRLPMPSDLDGARLGFITTLIESGQLTDAGVRYLVDDLIFRSRPRERADAFSEVHSALAKAHESKPTIVLSRVMKWARSPDPYRRISALLASVLLPEEAITEHLLCSRADPSPEARIMVAYILLMRSRRPSDVLPMLGDPDSDVSLQIAQLLMPTFPVADLVLEMLRHPALRENGREIAFASLNTERTTSIRKGAGWAEEVSAMIKYRSEVGVPCGETGPYLDIGRISPSHEQLLHDTRAGGRPLDELIADETAEEILEVLRNLSLEQIFRLSRYLSGEADPANAPLAPVLHRFASQDLRTPLVDGVNRIVERERWRQVPET